MTKEVINWNNKVGGKKAERIPCPDGIEGCLVAHYKVIEEALKQEQGETKKWVGLTDEQYKELSQLTHVEVINLIEDILKNNNT